MLKNTKNKQAQAFHTSIASYDHRQVLGNNFPIGRIDSWRDVKMMKEDRMIDLSRWRRLIHLIEGPVPSVCLFVCRALWNVGNGPFQL